MTTTRRDALVTKLAKGINSGIFGRDPTTKKLLLELATSEQLAADVTSDARVTSLEQRIAAPVADTTALKAIAAAARFDKMLAFVESAEDGLGHLYRFDSASVAAEDLPFVVAPTAGTGRWLIDEEAEREMGSAVADIAALKAVTAAQRTGGQIRLCVANGAGQADLYRFDALSAVGEALPDIVAPTAGTGRWLSYRAAIKAYADTLYDATGTAAGLLATKVLTPVVDTAALAALDMGDVLAAGVSCLVVNRGDGYAWRYRYVVGAVPTLNYGTVFGVRVYVAGTNGYWTPEDLPAYLALASEASEQRVGSLGGGLVGTASAWKLSDEANSATGHGFTLDWDGAHPEEVVVIDAVKDAGTSIALTVDLLNAAIANQCAVDSNARARIVYDEIDGAYRIVFPAGIATSALAITAPAAASDIGVGAKLAFATGTGAAFLRKGRSVIESFLAQTLAALVLPAGPLTDGGTNAIAITIDAQNILGSNLAKPTGEIQVWTSATEFGAPTALVDTAMVTTAGTDMGDAITVDGQYFGLTDATGNLNITLGHVAGALADVWVMVACGGYTDAVHCEFTA